MSEIIAPTAQVFVDVEFFLPYHDDFLNVNNIQAALVESYQVDASRVTVHECTPWMKEQVKVKGWVSTMKKDQEALTDKIQSVVANSRLSKAIETHTGVKHPTPRVSRLAVSVSSGNGEDENVFPLPHSRENHREEDRVAQPPDTKYFRAGSVVQIDETGKRTVLHDRNESVGGLQAYDGVDEDDAFRDIIQSAKDSLIDEEEEMNGDVGTADLDGDAGGVVSDDEDETPLPDADEEAEPADAEQMDDLVDQIAAVPTEEEETKAGVVDSFPDSLDPSDEAQESNPDTELRIVRAQLRLTRQQMDETKRSYDEQVQHLRNRVTALKARQMADMRQARMTQMEIQLEEQQVKKKLKEVSDAQVESLVRKMDDQNKAHDNMMHRLKSEHQQEIDRLNRTLRQSRELRRLEIANITEQHKAEMSQLKRAFGALESRVQEESEKDKLIKTLHKQIREKHEEIEHLKKDYDATIERMTEENQEEMDDLANRHNETVKRLNKKVREAKKEIAQLQREKKELERDVQDREEAQQELESEVESLNVQLRKEKQQRHILMLQSESRPSQENLLDDPSSTTSPSPPRANPYRQIHKRDRSFTMGHDGVILVERTKIADQEIKETEETDDTDHPFIVRSGTTPTLLNERSGESKREVKDLKLKIRNLETKLAELKLAHVAEVKALKGEVSQLKLDTDRQSEEFINDKQRLHYALKRKETTISRLETQKAQLQEKLEGQLREKEQVIDNLKQDVASKTEEMENLSQYVYMLKAEVQSMNQYEDMGVDPLGIPADYEIPEDEETAFIVKHADAYDEPEPTPYLGENPDAVEESPEFDETFEVLAAEKEELHMITEELQNELQQQQLEWEKQRRQFEEQSKSSRSTITQLEEVIKHLKEKDEAYSQLFEQEKNLESMAKDLEQTLEYERQRQLQDEMEQEMHRNAERAVKLQSSQPSQPSQPQPKAKTTTVDIKGVQPPLKDLLSMVAEDRQKEALATPMTDTSAHLLPGMETDMGPPTIIGIDDNIHNELKRQHHDVCVKLDVEHQKVLDLERQSTLLSGQLVALREQTGQQIDTLKKQLTTLTTQRASLENDLKATEASLEKTRGELSSTKNDISRLETEVSRLDAINRHAAMDKIRTVQRFNDEMERMRSLFRRRRP